MFVFKVCFFGYGKPYILILATLKLSDIVNPHETMHCVAFFSDTWCFYIHSFIKKNKKLKLQKKSFSNFFTNSIEIFFEISPSSFYETSFDNSSVLSNSQEKILAELQCKEFSEDLKNADETPESIGNKFSEIC